jgi:5-methylcytosine-specific restriction enzyme subunit McrC
MLAVWGLSRKLTGRLLALDQQLGEIDRVQFRAQDVDQFAYNRQSQDYRPIHRLCQFFLEGASLTEEAGDIAFDGFLVDMNVLFEELVTKALRERLAHPLLLEDQVRTTLDHRDTVHMRPDIVISTHRRPMLVADCKYKALATGEHRHHDLYQILAYCTALRIDTGTLIYPRHLVHIDTTLSIRGNGVQVQEISIDLRGTPEEIGAQFGALALRVQRWALLTIAGVW